MKTKTYHAKCQAEPLHVGHQLEQLARGAVPVETAETARVHVLGDGGGQEEALLLRHAVEADDSCHGEVDFDSSVLHLDNWDVCRGQLPQLSYFILI